MLIAKMNVASGGASLIGLHKHPRDTGRLLVISCWRMKSFAASLDGSGAKWGNSLPCQAAFLRVLGVGEKKLCA